MLDADSKAPQPLGRQFNPDEIERKRKILFGETVGDDELCQIIVKSKRTLRRLKARGMPYTNILGEDRHDLQAVAAWLTAHAQHSPFSLPPPRQDPASRRGPRRPRLYPKEDDKAAGPLRRKPGRPRIHPHTGPPP
jgi:hypothetical protein